MPSYDKLSSSYTFDQTTTDPYLVTGEIYVFRFRARNAIGYSDWSTYLKSAMVAVPGTPTNLRRTESGTTKTQLVIQWDPVADGAAPGGTISGYKLYMATGLAGGYVMVYDGIGLPTIKSKIVSGLTTGEIYRFKVLAINYNGESALSAEFKT